MKNSDFVLVSFLYALGAGVLALVVHELGHGFAGQLTGAYFEGVSFVPNAFARCQYPFVELAESARAWTALGGALSTILFGLACLLASLRFDGIAATMLASIPLFATFGCLLVGYGVLWPSEVYWGGRYFGVEPVTWLVVSLVVCVLLYAWFVVRIMRTIESTLVTAIVYASLPLVSITAFSCIVMYGSQAIALFVISPFFVWGIKQIRTKEVRHGLQFVLFAFVVMVCVGWFWSLGPPSADRIERWANSRNPYTLRLVSYHLIQRAQEQSGDSDRIEALVEEAREAARKAVAIDASVGSHYDFGSVLSMSARISEANGDSAAASEARAEALRQYDMAFEKDPTIREVVFVLAHEYNAVDRRKACSYLRWLNAIDDSAFHTSGKERPEADRQARIRALSLCSSDG